MGQSFKQWYNENLNGILGTIAIHFLFAIFLLSANINALDDKMETPIMIEFSEKKFDLDKEIEKLAVEKQQLLDQIAKQELGEKLKDIPVNVKSKIDQQLNPDDYLKEFKNQIGIEDPIEKTDEKTDLNIQEKQEVKKEEKKPSNYQGPTTISFELEGRTERYLHLPVYLCERSGKVVVDIKVDQQGNVVAAIINTGLSLIQDECLFQAALNSARRSRFNTDYKKPARQDGNISYVFKPQK
jgi:hypothetical protein